MISQPKAWEGALARVTEEFDGWFLSPVFPTFTANSSRLLPAYLEWFCKRKTVWRDLQILSKGMGARRETVSPEQFLSLEIPLPPVDEQRRVVSCIEVLATKVEEARGLRRQLSESCLALPRAIFAADRSGRRIRVSEFASLRSPDVQVSAVAEYHFAGVYSFGRGVFSRGLRKRGSEFAYEKLTRLQRGNFTYPKLMAWEGALGIVPENCDGLVVSTSFRYSRSTIRSCCLRLSTPLPLAERLATTRWPKWWHKCWRRRLNPADFLALEIPWPTDQVQSAIRNAVNQLSEVATLQAGAAAELDALMPAILDKAFKGEL